MTISDLLIQFGLDSKEAEIYLRLLRVGPTRASVLAYQMDLPRTTVQNILLRLEKEHFVTKIFQKNVHIFSATHPENLPSLLETKKRQELDRFQNIDEQLSNFTPQLLAMMHTKKTPNVRLYQGEEAVRTVLFDTLTSKTELKDFANIDAMFQYAKETNDEYVAAREKTKITKRSLLLDTPFAREVYEGGEYSPKSHKGYKWIKSMYPFALEMNIYDGKVSYITYVKDDFVGVIIENDYIYQMHNSMWNMMWDMLPEIKDQKSEVRTLRSRK